MRGSVKRRGKAWRVRVDAGLGTDGRRRYLSGTRPTKREADELLLRLVAEAGRGDALGSDSSLGELYTVWLRSDRLGPSYRYDVELVWKRVPDWLKAAPVWKLRASDLDRAYGEIRAAGMSASRIHRVHEVISSMLTQALRWEWVTRNVARSASPPAVKRKPIKPPKPNVLAKLLDVSEPTDLGLWVRLAATSGARRGEIADLRWSSVDFGARVVWISGALAYAPGVGVYEKGTKTDMDRPVSLDRRTVAMLRLAAYRQRRRAVLLGDTWSVDRFVISADETGRAPWRPDRATREFGKLRDAHGARDVKLKDLRHYVATRALAAGVDVRTVSGRLGHAQTSTTTDIYAAWLPEADKRTADLLAGELRKAR